VTEHAPASTAQGQVSEDAVPASNRGRRIALVTGAAMIAWTGFVFFIGRGGSDAMRGMPGMEMSGPSPASVDSSFADDLGRAEAALLRIVRANASRATDAEIVAQLAAMQPAIEAELRSLARLGSRAAIQPTAGAAERADAEGGTDVEVVDSTLDALADVEAVVRIQLQAGRDPDLRKVAADVAMRTMRDASVLEGIRRRLLAPRG